jgi:hypothetical protein
VHCRKARIKLLYSLLVMSEATGPRSRLSDLGLKELRSYRPKKNDKI